jgi:pyrimidine operon attenuation protein/uracil phosphoribosyltransferase
MAQAIAPTLTPDTALVGIHTGGVWIAERLHALLKSPQPVGTLDISFYRDDFSRIGLHPQVKPSNLPFDVEGRDILLIDDVLHSGRTVRAAMNELFDYGRPASIRLAVLVDRGGHELPIRPDFVGLPKGSGSVSKGEEVWVSKCASCHGDFGESNEVFTPIVGGTTAKDIETGRVANLRLEAHYPQRTTLMKVATVSTLWDYINRAMPWNAPKSLSTDEVYGVLAYILNLAEVVPADFTLSDQNIAEVQKRMPNRNGMVFY